MAGKLSAELAALDKRRQKAKTKGDETRTLRDEAYHYAIPFRRGKSTGSDGSSRVDDVFDHTAVDAAFRFAGKLQTDFWPAGQENFALEAGPLVTNEAERAQINEILGTVAKRVQAACFENGDFDMAFHEMALDLSAGTGAILMLPGDGEESVWEVMSVPIDELELEVGANGKYSGMFWQRRISVRECFESWPDGEYTEDFRKIYKDTPEKEISVNYDMIFERKQRRSYSRWRLVIWTKDQPEKRIHSEQSHTCPLAIPRYFRVPGESHGRGPVTIGLPGIKSLNAAARLWLQSASIALLGIYTTVNDGVFNPENAPLAPGEFWNVGRNGGPLGPSVSRLPDPRIDLGGLVIEQMQMNVKTTLLDQALPDPGAAVKSATEILERIKRLAQDHVGAFGRLVKELTIPVVSRAIELGYRSALFETPVQINQLLVRLRVKSPLAIAHEMQKVQKIVEYLEIAIAILSSMGQQASLDEYVKLDQVLTKVARLMRIDEEDLLSDDDRQTLRDEKQKQQMALAAASAAGGMAGGAA